MLACSFVDRLTPRCARPPAWRAACRVRRGRRLGAILASAIVSLTPAAAGADAPEQPQQPAAVVAGSATLAAGGQAPVPQSPASGRPMVTITRTQQPPPLDGRLDDPAWATAAHVTDLFQRRPVEGAPASEATDVYLTYDSQNIYVGVHAHYADPSIMRANRVDRDGTQNDDKVAIFLDPFLDQQRAYAFTVNAYGVQRDFLMAGGGSGGGGDNAWNALYETAGRIVEDGWVAEMAIPFKSLRYPARGPEEMHRWGFQIERDIEGKNESVVWSPMSSNVMGFVRQMGIMEGLTGLSTSRNLELLPTVTAIQGGSLNTSSGDFEHDGVEEAGLNVKYGITPNLTFDFTFNPDFSQIESDLPQIEVNQRFPLFFSELRPFFLEGREIYNVTSPVTLVHTRTVVDPRYGAKLSGKIGDAAIGLLVADDKAPGNVADPADPAHGHAAQVVLGRVRYDLYAASYVGLLFTDREFLDGYSRLAGIDSRWQIGRGNSLLVTGMAARRQGEDGERSSGELFDVQWRRESRGLSYTARTYFVDPDFRTDAGFVRRTNEQRTTADVSYRWWPEDWIVSWGPTATYERSYLRDGVLQDEVIQGGMNFQFSHYINAGATYNRDMEHFHGIDFRKSRYSFNGAVNTSRRIAFTGRINFGDEVRFIDSPFLGSSTESSMTVTLRPVSRLQSETRFTTSRFVDTRTDTEAFDVRILRTLTTYQFTDRFLMRNIAEYNTFDKTVSGNLLLTYRVNAGTVIFLGYDDHYRQGDSIDPDLFEASAWRRTNRAMFVKFQYLFRL